MPPKRDPAAEEECLCWIEAIIGEKFRDAPYDDVLKNGVVLCRLMDKLMPGSVNMKKVVTKGLDFKLMENIGYFQKGAKAYGIREDELFQTVDLWKKSNIPGVTKCIFALGRYAQQKGFDGPILGPKMAVENKREFTEEQKKEAQNVVSLQYGFAGGASQAGMNMGKMRSIND